MAELEPIFNFVKNELNDLGSLEFFGSAKKGRALKNGHDIDIGLFTNFRSRDYIESRAAALFKKWDNHNSSLLSRLPLHLYIVGKFDSELIYVNKNMLQFVRDSSQYYEHFLVALYKKLQKVSGIWKVS